MTSCISSYLSLCSHRYFASKQPRSAFPTFRRCSSVHRSSLAHLVTMLLRQRLPSHIKAIIKIQINNNGKGVFTMKKKLLSMSLALCMVFGSVSALPQSYIADNTSISASADTLIKYPSYNYYYKVLSDGTVAITDFTTKRNQRSTSLYLQLSQAERFLPLIRLLSGASL